MMARERGDGPAARRRWTLPAPLALWAGALAASAASAACTARTQTPTPPPPPTVDGSTGGGSGGRQATGGGSPGEAASGGVGGGWTGGRALGGSSASGGAGSGGAVGGGPAVGGGSAGGGPAGGGTSGTAVVALAVGPLSTCLIDEQRLVHCFGRCGPTGHGGSRELAPVGLHARAIAVGRAFACALLDAPESGSVLRCWGGGPAADAAPTIADATGAAEVVAGENHACVRAPRGDVTCWGDAAHAPPAGIAVKALAASGAMTCAIVTDDSVTCWGPHPAMPPADLRAKRIAVSAERADPLAGARFGCAIAMNDQVRCWGDDVGGTLAVPAGLVARDIGTAGAFACAAGLSGALTCWGTQPFFGAPVPAGANVSRLSLSFRTAGAILADRTFKFWGDLADGRGTAPGGIHAP